MDALKILGTLLPALVKWIEGEIAAGRDPKAQLESAMAAADLVADAAEDAKFPPHTDTP